MRGWQASLFVCLFLMAAPAIQGVSYVLLGRQALGEATALSIVALGLLLMLRGWTTQHWTLLALAGVACGVGILSRQQWGLALGPALLAVAVLRSLRQPTRWWLNIVPLVTLALMILTWKAIEFIGTPPGIRDENSLMALDAMRTNLITGLWGRTLTPSALSISAIMTLGGGIALWRARACFRRTATADVSQSQWIELTLGLFVVFTLAWFVLLSVGWPRYAFAGLMVAWLFIGGALWDGVQAARRKLAVSMPRAARMLPSIAIAAALLLQVVRSVPELTEGASVAPQQTADFIGRNIPRDAVIETWEWELDALSGHWQYHHPHQRYLFEAIRQSSHEQRPFDLRYDALQANPDYLVAGPFSDWTRLYDQAVVEANFKLLTQIGPYRVYARQRSPQ
jgi:hypothetical protein